MTAEVWVKSARRCLTGLDSVVHPELLRSKESLSSSSWDPEALLLGHVPLNPCDGASREGPGLSPWWWLGFFLPLFSSPKCKASDGTSLPGPEAHPGSDIGEVRKWGAKLWGRPAWLVDDERGHVS